MKVLSFVRDVRTFEMTPNSTCVSHIRVFAKAKALLHGMETDS